MKTSFMRIFFMQYWWVIAFGLLCMMIYENGLKSRQQLYSQLTNQLRILEMEKQQAIEEQKKTRISPQQPKRS